MSAVQAGGGKGSGQRPPGTAGGRPPTGTKPAPPGTRPAPTRAKPGAPGRAPARRPPATKTGSGGAGGGGGRGPKQPGGYRPGAARPPGRFSASTLAFAAVAVVVVLVVVFVVVKVTSNNTPSASVNGKTISAPVDTVAPLALVNKVESVPNSVANAVGIPSTSVVNPPTVKKGEPALTIDGKPGAVFIGGEFCPFCAAERWSIIMAFSKFGTFSNLKETTSSPWDTDPSTPTFSFYGATYQSNYITFDTSEHATNDKDGVGTSSALQPLTKQEANLWQTYDNDAGFPFLDIGNKALVTSPSYVPTVLAGLDQDDVASKLTNPKDPVTQSIVGTANYLTAAICATTGQKPASVCSVPAIGKAAKAMGLS